MTRSSEHFVDHKLFIVIVFYKNILCLQGASSSCRVLNLKLSHLLSTVEAVKYLIHANYYIQFVCLKAKFKLIAIFGNFWSVLDTFIRHVKFQLAVFH